jgi:ArsR family transcriptional regulator
MIGKKKQLLFEKQAEIAKSLAHPLRMAIIDFLKDGPQCVCDIAKYVGSERSNVSRHLTVMVSAGLLASRKEGLKVIYRLKTPCVLECFSCLADCLKQRIKDSQKLLRAL